MERTSTLEGWMKTSFLLSSVAHLFQTSVICQKQFAMHDVKPCPGETFGIHLFLFWRCPLFFWWNKRIRSISKLTVFVCKSIWGFAVTFWWQDVTLCECIDPLGIMGHETILAVLCRVLLQATIWVANMLWSASCDVIWQRWMCITFLTLACWSCGATLGK